MQSVAVNNRQLMSGNEAVARAVWEAGVKVAAAYPGTPSTEILEYISNYPDVYSEWSINEKVSLEVAIGASLAGSRALCAMKHVGLNVASDALMTQTLVGAVGGLVIAVADDVGLSSSQNEQDSRFWGRFAHVPVLEPSDAQEAYEFTKYAFELSEQFSVPVIVRMTTRICHVKGVVSMGERVAPDESRQFEKDPTRLVMVPGHAKNRIPKMYEREAALDKFSNDMPLNYIDMGEDTRIGFITSGAAFLHVKEAFPDAPVLKLGLGYPLPKTLIADFTKQVDQVIVVEETEPLVETELKALGLAVKGKEVLPRIGELSPAVLKPAIKGFLGEEVVKPKPMPKVVAEVFPRPPTMCVACPHLGVYYCLSKVRNTIISGDIGCYTLGAGHPWNALDTCISMGASISMALGLDKGRNPADEKKAVVAVIGDSTFLHMGMQGLLDVTYNKGNITLLLLDNRAVGMTGGQDNPASGRDIHGEESLRVDFAKLVEALGVKKERIREADPYELPTFFKTLREETKIAEPSVIITNQPCVLIDDYEPRYPFTVNEDACNGCGNCLDVGCPAIFTTRRETVIKPNGSEKELSFVDIESNACTGCDLCTKTCGPDAIVHVSQTPSATA